MNTIAEQINSIMSSEKISRIIVSKAATKSSQFKKIDVLGRNDQSFQISKYTDKQAFHENVQGKEIAAAISDILFPSDGKVAFRQVNLWSESFEHIFLISKDGSFTHKKRALKSDEKMEVPGTHNREKNYIIEEGQKVPPLIDMGVFTKDGKVVKSMYDKFRQINRFLEILDDEIGSLKTDHLNVIDFGCGKSYLTFVVYYYLTEIKGIKANIIGLDLKKDVIRKCNEAANKYGYENLHFELGDINGYKTPFDVDMVITLHACDTATDYALYNAIMWNAKMIFSVPCCQHELNKKIKTDELSLLTRYGIIKERFAALATDAIRGNLLEYSGYKTQLLEFIDFAHTPKNILIRAVKRGITPKGTRDKALKEVENLMREFNTDQTLYDLLVKGKE
ncbi:MAG: SAM-dependent methyltransferase [Butyrivibrio sp.]|nr:SAM-dependent methyltransferase [Butyrivibrio sp.]